MKSVLSRIDYSKSFNKQLKKAPLSIKIAFRQRLELFIRDQLHPQLNNHSLTGKYKDYGVSILLETGELFIQKEKMQSYLNSSVPTANCISNLSNIN